MATSTSLHNHISSRCKPAPVPVLRSSSSRDRRALSALCRAAESGSFDTSPYFEAWVENVRVTTEPTGSAFYLRLKDGKDGAILPVYIGEFECSALIKEINHRPTTRPMTHDLFKNAVELVGYKVVLVRIHQLVGNTYHARIHLQKQDGGPVLDIDARPSDAVNMALRFRAPIYVSKEIAARMAVHDGAIEQQHFHHTETNAEISRSCKAEVLRYQDPTLMLKLQLQLAIQEERYKDATALRDQIEKIISQDQSLRLIVAIETALEDGRFEEAAKLRDELHSLRRVGSNTLQQGDVGL